MLINYQLNIHYNLSSLTEIISTNNIEIDNYLDTILQIIFYSSRCNIPKAHFVPHIKPYWTSEVKKAHKIARQSERYGLVRVDLVVWFTKLIKIIRQLSQKSEAFSKKNI